MLDMMTTTKRTDIQTTVLTGTWAHTHSEFRIAVAWSRALNTCPGCGQSERPVDRDCPVTTDGGNPSGDGYAPWSTQHGCGTWWGPVAWEAQILDRDQDDDEVLDALAVQVASDYDAEIDRLRDNTRGELTKALTEFLADPEGNEFREGSDVHPGVWDANSDGTGWEAWDFDPDGSGDVIVVTADEVTR